MTRWPEFTDHKGGPCPFPKDKQRGFAKYQRPADDPVCRKCGCTVLYQENDQCVVCFAKEAWSDTCMSLKYPTTGLHARAMGLSYFYTPEPCSKGAHLVTKDISNPRINCWTCSTTKRSHSGEKCPDCDQRAAVRADTGECGGCHPSPRQLAIKAGDSKYLPDVPCPHCNTIALKRVDNGQCDQCILDARGGVDGRATRMDEPSRVLMESAPDTVLDRPTARAMGLTIYRTGEECTNGHTGWRYVSTGGCITCKREAKE